MTRMETIRTEGRMLCRSGSGRTIQHKLASHGKGVQGKEGVDLVERDSQA